MAQPVAFVNTRPINLSSEGLHAAFLGSKTVTIREGRRRSWRPGLARLECRGEKTGLTILITQVRHCLLREVTDEEWLADGMWSPEYLALVEFASEKDLAVVLQAMQTYYPNLTWSSPVTVIRWELR